MSVCSSRNKWLGTISDVSNIGGCFRIFRIHLKLKTFLRYDHIINEKECPYMLEYYYVILIFQIR